MGSGAILETGFSYLVMYTIKFLLNVFKIKAQTKILERKSLKLNKHILVLESDDWGSIRMPSVEVRDRLLNNDIKLSKALSYDLFDTIESNDDMLYLMETLSAVRDSMGHPALMTMNCVLANPDFDRIRKGDYNTYYYETIEDTYKKYPNRDKVMRLWEEGIRNHSFKPQMHGREHLNYQKWIQLLKEDNNGKVREAFQEGVFSLDEPYYVLPALDAVNTDYYEGIKRSLSEGYRMFEDIFGFKSNSFIAPCYTWDSQIEKFLFDLGISYLQGHYFQTLTSVSRNIKKRNKAVNYLGKKNLLGQIYLVRNCQFEPSEERKRNGDYCLKQIVRHFNAGRPAIVSCHRQNFIGANCTENRDNNLKDLKKMLERLVKMYPDVVFMSSDELGNTIKQIIR